MQTVSFLTVLSVGVVFCMYGVDACAEPAAPLESTTVCVAAPMKTADVERCELGGAVSARDDFYEHVNGSWLNTTQIPADQSAWGPFSQLEDDTQTQLKNLIEGLGSRPSDRGQAKITALYASFMDEGHRETLGFSPITSELNRVEALENKNEIPALIAHFNQIHIGAPYEPLVHQDARDSTRYIVDLRQSGLGLPDRDYYVNEAQSLKTVREQYQRHIEKMMTLAGAKQAGADALAILGLETALAKIQWTQVENRDPIKTYNKYPLADLSGLIRDYDWQSYLTGAGFEGKTKFLIISQPSYLAAFGRLVKETPLAMWKSYFKWRVLCTAAPYLSKAFVDGHFAFYGTALRGIPENRPRSNRGVTLVNELIGEELGKLYVKQYFPPKTKDNIDAMLQVVLAAYRTRIKSLDWMGPDSQKAAQQKLNKLVLKIGYPAQYRDYDKLKFAKDDLFGNVTRGVTFEYQRNIAKLGKPIDRDEWKTLPQTVAAYYDPQLNEIAFAAAMLQAPFYEANADDAANYGGIGVVIGREIAHAFDDVGSQYAANGQLRDWFTGQDHDKFEAKIEALVAQYDLYEWIPGVHVSGERTLGENIADNAGVAIAYQAYHLALAGKEAPIINGLTGDQRLFASFAHVWRSKIRAAEAGAQFLSDGQSPPGVRVDASLMNQPSFATAFSLEQGDKMYLAPSHRVALW